ncbi:MAG: alkaline phosphatase [Lewinellaceae bacterium]|nr:alkaline phosphatase [Lewinellaceae bacterium]
MIGDGMGLTQISAGLYANNNQLNLEKFPVIGLHKSYASNNLITDSAAGATAFSAGVKTYNGAIGVDKDSMPVPTILEDAIKQGLRAGLVSTSSITHATPASFIAHAKTRRAMEDIASDFLQTPVDIFIGGGMKYFANREDGRDLTKELASKGYVINDYTKKEITDVTLQFRKRFGYFTSDSEPLPVAQGRNYLVPAAKMATVFLQNIDQDNKGFFLMIEGSQIDWGGHAKDSDYIITEMIDFDKAIGAVLDFAREDGETLVIVTADHETGGYAIMPGSRMGRIEGAFTTDYHTAALIPVFAFGPGAELFAGIYENTAIYTKMRTAFGW